MLSRVTLSCDILFIKQISLCANLVPNFVPNWFPLMSHGSGPCCLFFQPIGTILLMDTLTILYNLKQPKDILESYSAPRLDGENYRGQQAFLYIEQLKYNQSRVEPKLHIGVSRSRSEPHSSMSKTSRADRSRQSSKGPDRSVSTFEQIVHLCSVKVF